MNIFLKVLKHLIGTELMSAANKQNKKGQSFFYTNQLSIDQKGIITQLNTDIIRFDGVNNDEADTKTIFEMIKKAYEQVEKTRSEYKVSKNSGETITSLKDLKSYVPELYKKLNAFKFKLLNKSYTETPEGIVYFHACLYLGEEIFNPMKRIDQTIREEKEDRLAVRLQLLEELIQPTYTLEERKIRTLNLLGDLASDNEKIIDKANASNYIPVSFAGGLLGAQLQLSEILGHRLGRFSEQFGEALRKINNMTAETFDFKVISKIEDKKETKIEDKEEATIEMGM